MREVAKNNSVGLEEAPGVAGGVEARLDEFGANRVPSRPIEESARSDGGRERAAGRVFSDSERAIRDNGVELGEEKGKIRGSRLAGERGCYSESIP